MEVGVTVPPSKQPFVTCGLITTLNVNEAETKFGVVPVTIIEYVPS